MNNETDNRSTPKVDATTQTPSAAAAPPDAPVSSAEETPPKFCMTCGQPLSGKFCSACGTPAHQTAPPAADGSPVAGAVSAQPAFAADGGAVAAPPRRSGLVRVLLILAAVLVLAFGGFKLWEHAGKKALHQELMRDWSRVEMEGSTYYSLTLEFSESRIDYRFKALYFDTSIATMRYEVIGPSTILVDGKEVEVSFNGDKSMMTLRPAITSLDRSENWFG